jgi:hypothetical protein
VLWSVPRDCRKSFRDGQNRADLGSRIEKWKVAELLLEEIVLVARASLEASQGSRIFVPGTSVEPCQTQHPGSKLRRMAFTIDL